MSDLDTFLRSVEDLVAMLDDAAAECRAAVLLDDMDTFAAARARYDEAAAAIRRTINPDK